MQCKADISNSAVTAKRFTSEVWTTYLLSIKGQLHQSHLTLSRDNSGANLYLAKITLHRPQFATNGFLNHHLS